MVAGLVFLAVLVVFAFIVLTGRHELGLERHLLALGAVAYLRKPLMLSELLTALRPHLLAAGELEHHPALLALLCDICPGASCAIINVYLAADGRSRLRDAKGKTVTGRAKGTVVMLSAFEEPTYGLTVCEGTETGVALLMADLAPVWCCGGAGNLSAFPLLGGIEALTIAADADEPGQKAAEAVAARWREAGREVVIVAPPTGDWADGRG